MHQENRQGVAGGNQRAACSLALDILCRGVGHRMATNVQYQERLNVGSGTVQKALQSLKRAGAVSVQARGHQGTFITDLDFGALWRTATIGELKISMTAPGAIEAHGLAQGLSDEARRLGIPIVFEYVRGAEVRTRRVLTGTASAVVLSCGAAKSIGVSAQSKVLDAIDLGVRTYYHANSVVVISRPAEVHHPTRIAIDSTSYDHERLTYAEFPSDEGYEYVDCDFPSIPAAVLEGRADAGVWHRLSMLVPLRLLDLDVRSLARPGALQTVEHLSNAQILWRTDRPEIAAFLRLVRTEVIRARQLELLKLDPDSSELRAQLWLG